MDGVLPISHPIRSADVAGRRPVAFALAPDAAVRAGVAAALGIPAVQALRFDGAVAPAGKRDVTLAGTLTARVVQPCVVTLDPVTTDLRVPVERRYIAGLALPEAGEVEMPEDDREEPLPDVIDIGAVLIEALALALPDYPRSPGAALGTAAFGPPGAAPLTDADLRPFAALAALRTDGPADDTR